MTINELIKKVMEINPAIYCEATGAYTIEGNYRAKKSEKFAYDCKNNTFLYNTCKPPVASAFEQALASETF
jgi:hypothetical protein